MKISICVIVYFAVWFIFVCIAGIKHNKVRCDGCRRDMPSRCYFKRNAALAIGWPILLPIVVITFVIIAPFWLGIVLVKFLFMEDG